MYPKPMDGQSGIPPKARLKELLTKPVGEHIRTPILQSHQSLLDPVP